MELVSIIIPAYNVESYIRKCVESVIVQTYKDLEVIVINDGSTDSTFSQLMELKEKDSRIKVISWPNQGLSAARNLGIEISNGDFIFFLDGDDWLDSTCVERMIAVQKQENSDIVVADYMRFREEDSNFLLHIAKEDYYTKTYSMTEWFMNMENEGMIFVFAWGKLYKKELFKNLRYPINMKMEDAYTTYLSYLLTDRISYIHEPLYIYRVNPSGIMSTSSKKDRYPARPLEEEITILSMLGMNNEIAIKSYYNRLHFLKEELSSKGQISYEYYKICTFLEILKKHGYTQ